VVEHQFNGRDQVQIRSRDDRLRHFHVADHVRTAGGQLLQSNNTHSLQKH